MTFEEGYAIQREQANRWKTVLTTEAAKALDKEIERHNIQGYDHPYQIWRGMNIDTFLHNFATDTYNARNK